MLPEEQICPEKRDDWREVRNDVAAMNQAIVDLKPLPLSNPLLCAASTSSRASSAARRTGSAAPVWPTRPSFDLRTMACRR